MSNELEKAIRYFKNMRDDNKIVLDSDFGMKKGESNLLYKNRKKYAELAIEALEKQIAKKPRINRVSDDTEYMKCPQCKLATVLYSDMKPDYCPKCGQKLDWNVEE